MIKRSQDAVEMEDMKRKVINFKVLYFIYCNIPGINFSEMVILYYCIDKS